MLRSTQPRLKLESSTTERILSWLYQPQPLENVDLPELQLPNPCQTPSWLTTLLNSSGWFNPFKGRHPRQSVVASTSLLILRSLPLQPVATFSRPSIALTALLIAQSLQTAAAYCFKNSAGNLFELTCYGKESEEDLFKLFHTNCSASTTQYDKSKSGDYCVSGVLWDINDPLKLFFPTTTNFGQSKFSNPICIMKYFRDHGDACINSILVRMLQNDQWLTREKAYVGLGVTAGAIAGLTTFGILACCVVKKCSQKRPSQIIDIEAHNEATESTVLTSTLTI